MRDIVPRPSSSKENVALRRSASCAGQSSTKVTVEMKTVVTPQSKAPSSQFITPKTPAHLSRSRSNAAALFTKKTPCSTIRSNHEATTPAGVGEITPGTVKRLVMHTPTPARIGVMTPGARSGVTPVKRKMAGTPLSCASGSKAALNHSTTKILSASQNDIEEESHVTVAVRLRPLNQKEKKESCCVVETGEDGLVTVAADNASLSFQYDHCFGSAAKQSEVFCSLVHPLLSKALEGYNACLFSYGQTGSGKTYSMMGAESSDNGKNSGIIPRFSFSLFERISKSHNVSVEVSYFEIYNEKIRDLLCEDVLPLKTALRVREHPQLGPYVEGLAVHSVATFESLQGWLRLGLSRRATAASAMNDKSSRSHCIFSVTLTQGSRRSKVHLVDLAGSERLASTAATGDRLKEGVSINTSLLTLGKVISALADKQRKTFVPYRDSLLTWLLSDSLGGNARTVMLATVSPARLYVEETLATLRYACQARTIVNRPQLQPAATPVQHRQLQEEVERLRAARDEYVGAGRELSSLQAELMSVRHKLHELEQERVAWEERVKVSEDNRSRQTAELARRGVVECSCPVLRLLTPDPSLSLCFALPGDTSTCKVLGSQQPPADIALQAPLVAPQHCVLQWRDDMVWLIPDDDETAETYVNGELVREELPLEHGDRLGLAGELFLLVQLEPSTSAAIDYEWARMELSLAQNTKLNLELVEAKEKAILELQATRAQVEQLGVSKSAVEAELELRRGEQKRLVAALEAEVQEERRRREMVSNMMETSLAPFTSSLLQELGELGRGFVDAGAGLGLHEMRCLVREATQRCRQLGLYYVFSQVQQAQTDLHPGQPALQPCVRVRGKDRLLAECSPHMFLSLLELLRQYGEQEGDVSTILELMSALAWQEEAESSTCRLESSVTVDIAPFTRHMLSVSLTVHDESPATDVFKHLLLLHATLAKIETATCKQPKVQSHITVVKNAICQLERACHHPELDSYQHSEPSSIAHHSSSVYHHNLESYEHKDSVHDVQEEVIQLHMGNNTQPEFSTLDTSSAHTNPQLQPSYNVSRKSEDGTYSSVDVEMILQQLREPSLSSSVSTTLHSPPSISAQPSKSNLRQSAPPNSPTKEVRFTLKKPRRDNQ